MKNDPGSLHNEVRSKSGIHRPRWSIQLLITFISICVLCPLAIYLLEIFPRFITLPIPPPDYYMGELAGGWDFTTYSVLIGPDATPFSPGRMFIWRRETVVIYDESHGIVSSKSISTYFNEKLSRMGWTPRESYAPCDRYMPEANLIELNHARQTYYRREDYKPQQDFEEGDLICLIIRENDGAFNVVLLTARPSIFTILGDILF